MQLIAANYKHSLPISYRLLKKVKFFFHLKLSLATVTFKRVILKILSSVKKLKYFYVS